ncbi:hypothetical protein B0O99DRAFT_212668 [Bisporella sp. PMI_857]|nr:hypothetical protein B0O99DRAFT_212668 [Bisporella sp. PMI_857]
MGKSKPRNRNKNRADPKAKPIKPLSDPELVAIRDSRILPVLKDLQSADLKTRSTAAKAITNIIDDAKCRKLLLREQIVCILLEQTLTDSNLETRAAGWGILRNLALEEEADFCVHLFRQDILTAVEGMVRSIIETIQSEQEPFSKLPKAKQDLVWNLTGSITGLLTSLCEAQAEIVDAISKLASVIRFLFGLILLENVTPLDVQNDALLSLAALTEENKSLCQQIAENDEWFNALLQIKDSKAFKAVAACGVLHNIFSSLQWFDHNTPKDGVSDALLIPSLVSSMEHASGKSNGTNDEAAYSSPDEILQLALQITASIATSLQEALEHGSRFEKEFKGFGDADETNEDDKMEEDAGLEDDEIPEDEEKDDEMNDEEIEADMERVLGTDSDNEGGSSEAVTLDRLVRTVAPGVLQLAQSSSVPVRDHALATLNNISWTVSSIDFSTGHLSSLQKFWATLTQSIWNELISPVLASNTADIELASSITSLAWAVCRSQPGSIQIKPEEQRKFMALYHASKNLPVTDDDDAFQALGVKTIGVLGRLALDPAPVELNREIGVFLITILTGEPPAADAVEALDQIFDIYSDINFSYDEPVFWGDGFYKHLEEILPKVKKLAKTIDKRKLGELRARIDEAVLNLSRFLKYKRTEKGQNK